MALVQKLRPEAAAMVGAEAASRITTEVVTKILRQHADYAVQQAGHGPKKGTPGLPGPRDVTCNVAGQ